MGCVQKREEVATDQFKELYLKPVRQLIDKNKNQRRVKGSLKQRQAIEESCKRIHESEEEEKQEMSASITWPESHFHQSVHRRQIVKNVLSSEEECRFIHLRDQLIFLEDTNKENYPDEELFKVLGQNKVSVVDFLKGSRKEIMHKVHQNMEAKYQKEKKRIIEEFHEEPLTIDFHEHFETVKDSIFQ